jgi:hypothetical protein
MCSFLSVLHLPGVTTFLMQVLIVFQSQPLITAFIFRRVRQLQVSCGWQTQLSRGGWCIVICFFTSYKDSKIAFGSSHF